MGSSGHRRRVGLALSPVFIADPAGWTQGQQSPQAPAPAETPALIALPEIGGSQVSGAERKALTGSARGSAGVPAAGKVAPLPHGEGARRMNARIRAILAGYDWRSDPNKPFQRTAYLELILTRHLERSLDRW